MLVRKVHPKPGPITLETSQKLEIYNRRSYLNVRREVQEMFVKSVVERCYKILRIATCIAMNTVLKNMLQY